MLATMKQPNQHSCEPCLLAKPDLVRQTVSFRRVKTMRCPVTHVFNLSFQVALHYTLPRCGTGMVRCSRSLLIASTTSEAEWMTICSWRTNSDSLHCSTRKESSRFVPGHGIASNPQHTSFNCCCCCCCFSCQQCDLAGSCSRLCCHPTHPRHNRRSR